MFQFSSVTQLCLTFGTPWIAAHQASLSITNSRSSPKLMSIKLVMPSSHLILYCPLFLLPQCLPASGSFPVSQFFTWGGQSIGVSASAAVPPVNTQDWSPLGWTGWTSLQSKGLSRSLFQHHSSKASILWCSAFFRIPALTSTHDHWKNHSLDKVIPLLFNMLSRLVITFLPRRKRLLISWLESPSAMILEPKKNKVWHCFHCFPIYLPWSAIQPSHPLLSPSPPAPNPSQHQSLFQWVNSSHQVAKVLEFHL